MVGEELCQQALGKDTVLCGRYVIESVLGQGGFGITYLARDYQAGEKLVAVKEYFPTGLGTRLASNNIQVFSGETGHKYFQDGKKNFLREAKRLSKFNQDNGIAHVYTFFEENNTAYFAMEYIRGRSFQDYLDSNGSLGWDEVMRLFQPMLTTLERVHRKGIIHRDIKPENLLVGDNGAITLVDFGAARENLGEKSGSLDIILTPGFAPLEQYSRHGKQGAFTDVYALAATMYYALTGCIPPEATERVAHDTLQPPRKLGAKLTDAQGQALLHALAVNAENRTRSIREFRSALGMQSHRTVESVSRKTVNTPQPPSLSGRHASRQGVSKRGAFAWNNLPLYAVLLALVAVATIVACCILFIPWGPNRPQKETVSFTTGAGTAEQQSDDAGQAEPSEETTVQSGAANTEDARVIGPSGGPQVQSGETEYQDVSDVGARIIVFDGTSNVIISKENSP